MFWGIILEPKRRYTQTVQQSFHVSMAALDGLKETTENVQVMASIGDKTFLLCTLNSTTLQNNLDLEFEQGSQVTFTHNGKGHVHLTGYLIPGDDFDEEAEDEEVDDEEADDEEADEEEADDEEEVEEEEVKVQVGNKRKKNKENQPNKKQKMEVEEESSDEDSNEAENEDSDEEEVPTLVQSSPQKNGGLLKKTIQAGVQIEDLRLGKGPVAKSGKSVDVYYVGRLKSNNKQFDAKQSGKPFRFKLGKQQVIQGWDIGVSGMEVGGKRRITCPPNAAYGAKGSPPVIPPNSTLVFEVELKSVR